MLDKSQLQAQGIHTIDTNPHPESQKLLALLKEHAPHAFRDGKLDFKALTRLLGEEAEYASYELNFLGKREANKLSNTPATKELKSEPDRSSDFDTTGNAIIIGDNLHALKTLKSAYYGKVKMIYIDPPYNTGSDGFIYRDHFGEDYKNILRELNLMELNDDGEEMLSKRINYCKNIFGDKTHSGWLSFMYPRLKLARELLRDDGVIFISIDDNEQANLKILCDEIFGEHNFIETFLWNKTQTPPSASNKTRKTHEFILCYQKVKDGKKMIARFSSDGDAPLWNETNTKRDLLFPASYVYTHLKDGIYKKGIRDKIELLDDIEVCNGKIINAFRLRGHFRWKQDTLDKEILENVYLVVKSDKLSIRYCRQGDRIVMPTNEISKKDSVGTNETASSELKMLFESKDKFFSFNKPVSLIKYLTKLITTQESNNDIILDFFAGSGTTAHAVMELNAEDKNNGKQGNRKFILVQLDEAIKQDGKDKIVYDFCKGLGSENPTIADITIERVKRAGQKIREANKDSTIDTGFKVFSLIDKQRLNPQDQDLLTLASSPLTPYQKAINLALHAGRTLDTRIQPVIEDKLYRDERNFYLIACDKEVQKYLTADKNKDIFLSGYEDIAIQDLLNLQASIQKTRLKVLF